MDMSRAPIELYIDELMLEGVAPGDRLAIAEALRGELARLLAAAGLPGMEEDSRVVADLDGGALQLHAGAAPRETGPEVAQTLYRGLVR
jgi:hypothetical protein